MAASRVLVIGLDPHRVPGPCDPEPVAAAIREGLTRFADHGVAAESCLVGLDGRDDPAQQVRDTLRSGSWDCVVVGGGIRTADDLLDLFETVVNLIREHAPDAAIAFNARPADTYDAAARWLPDRQSS